MEEVRRLRVQQRIKSVKAINEHSELEVTEMPEIPSSIPFLPNVVSYLDKYPCYEMFCRVQLL